eukprot:TRINITY_DN26932_c0_g1_i2.p1 TRINITY_DN26932_c0_g1~~TRINITY_DN26932_c0_g1_i2.p1  ORF type:complete len:480 (-),score=49.76 TRINITY_DN26932_c0_g1_i2:177-1547(-)
MPVKRRSFFLISFLKLVACATNVASEQSSPQCSINPSAECSAADSGDVAISRRNLVQTSMLTGNTQRATEQQSLSLVDRAKSHATLLSKAGVRLLQEQPVLASVAVVSLLVALVALAWLMSDHTVAQPAPAHSRTPTLGRTPMGTASSLPCPDPRSERWLRSREEPVPLLAKLSPRILQESRPSSAMMPQYRLSGNLAEEGWPTQGKSQQKRSAHSPPPVPRLQMPTQRPYACAELVVPPGSESVLAIRIPTVAQAKARTSVDIFSLDGTPLLTGEVVFHDPVVYSFSGNAMMSSPRLSYPGGRKSEVGQGAAITLKRFKVEATHSLLKTPRSGLTDTTLVTGVLATGSRGQPALSVCGADGTCWGKLEKTLAGHFALLVSGDSMANMAFKGNYRDHDIQVLGENQQLLAKVELFNMSTQPDHKFISVTIRPMVDAGVILVCMIAHLHSLPMPWDD